VAPEPSYSLIGSIPANHRRSRLNQDGTEFFPSIIFCQSGKLIRGDLQEIRIRCVQVQRRRLLGSDE
jgi:hypothetical protein